MRFPFYRAIMLVPGIFVSGYLAFSQTTFSWASYVGVTNTPVGATDYSQTITSGTVSTTVYANIFSSGNGSGAADNTILVNSSPKYITIEADGGCGTQNSFQSGLAIYCDWNDYGTATSSASTQYPFIKVTIAFTGHTNGVCGPVNFSIYDINQDGSTQTFKDWVEITALDGNNAYIVPSIGSGTQKCNYNMNTYSNPAGGPLQYNGSSSCTCWPDYITLGSASSVISSITIKYYPDHTGVFWNTSPRNPAMQYIVISNITTGGVGCAAIVLSVELLSFNGSCKGAGKTLEWVTATEKNNSHFILEHSSDAQEFKEVGRVEGHRNTTLKSKYSFTIDEEPVQYMYYRLKQVDMDGRETILKSLYLDCVDRISRLKLYPNPARAAVRLEYEAGSETQFSIQVTDISGRIVRSYIRTADAGPNQTTLSIEDLPNGVYQVLISDVNGQWRQQFLKLVKNQE